MSASRLCALLLVLVAFALRAVRLDGQSLWSDEGISLVRSSLPLSDMLAQMPVEHVPGYFLLLKGWIALTGTTDYALRYLSLLPSVWAVALLYRLAADLGSRWIGLLAATLLATNGFQVWYAQELRMYSWLLAAGLLSTLCFWRLLTGSPNRGWGIWTLYVLATTATVYLHFFGFLVPISHAVFAGVWWLRGGGRDGLLRWAGAGVVVAILFLPWAARAWDLLAFEGWRAPLDPMQTPRLLLRAYSVGETMPAPWAAWLPWLYLALAVLGLAAWSRCARAAALFLGLLLATALAVVWLLVVRQPDFHVRYPIFLSVPLLLLAAGGLAGLSPGWWRPGRHSGWDRLVPLLGLAGLVAANGLALHRLYTDANLHKPDFRGAAQTIQAGVQPNDVVLVDGPNPDLVFNHYYDGPAPVHDLRPLEGASTEEVASTLAELTAGKESAWELLYFHTPGPVQVWLATHSWPAAPSDYNGIRVLAYALDTGPLEMRPLDVAVGPALVLAEAGVGGPQAKPGALLRVTTRWQVNAPPPDYKFSLRLQSAGGQVVAADDYAPQGWFAPTSTWTVGAPATDQHALRLPGDLAPGRYAITLRLYDPATGIAVESAAGQDIPLGEIEITPATGE
jgi:hypothetical protein